MIFRLDSSKKNEGIANPDFACLSLITDKSPWMVTGLKQEEEEITGAIMAGMMTGSNVEVASSSEMEFLDKRTKAAKT